MIKLVALDLDGTIVNEDLRISDRTLKLLRHLLTHTDIRVVIATGRMFFSALPFARDIGITDPLVTYQGAMVRDVTDGHALRFHQPIPLAIAKEVMELLEEDRYHTNLYIGDDLFTREHPDYSSFYARTSGITPQYTEDLLGALTEAPTKIMVIDNDRIDTLLTTLSARFPGRLSVCKSRSNFCEVIDVTASKWNALKSLANEWDIAPEEIMAIGDQGNDISMITHAGIGVAMGQAPDEIKQLANYVTGTIHQDGAADAIERFALGHVPLAD